MASIVVAGDTSGTVTLSAPSVAGTTTLTLPTTTGTVLASNSATTLNSGSSAMTLQTNGTTAMTIDTSQNVGIGTTSPSSKLQVEGNFLSATGLLVKDTTSGSGLSSYFNASNYTDADCIIKVSQVGAATKYVSIGPSVSIPLTFRTADTERMRIDSSGNVLVGTTSNFASGSVQGIAAQASGNASLALNRTTDTGAVARFYQAGTNVGRIDVTGSATSYVTSSDYRLKENVQPMVGALDKVLQLNPVTYTWKQDGTEGQGFIAHELQEVVPDCVVGEKDAVNEDGSIDPQGIDTSFLVATLTAAIQELTARVKEIEAKVK